MKRLNVAKLRAGFTEGALKVVEKERAECIMQASAAYRKEYAASRDQAAAVAAGPKVWRDAAEDTLRRAIACVRGSSDEALRLSAALPPGPESGKLMYEAAALICAAAWAAAGAAFDMAGQATWVVPGGVFGGLGGGDA